MTPETEFSRTHARADEIDTSHDAASSAQSMAKRHKARVYAALKSGVPQTSEELARRTGLHHSQVWRRVSDLRNDGSVIDTGQRRLNRSGRQAAVWALAPNHIAP